MKRIALLVGLLLVVASGSAHARACGACGPGGDNCIQGNWGFYCIHDFPSGCYMYDDASCLKKEDPPFQPGDDINNPKSVTDLETEDAWFSSGHMLYVYARHRDGTKELIHQRWVPEKKTWAMSQLKTIYR